MHACCKPSNFCSSASFARARLQPRLPSQPCSTDEAFYASFFRPALSCKSAKNREKRASSSPVRCRGSVHSNSWWTAASPTCLKITRPKWGGKDLCSRRTWQVQSVYAFLSCLLIFRCLQLLGFLDEASSVTGFSVHVLRCLRTCATAFSPSPLLCFLPFFLSKIEDFASNAVEHLQSCCADSLAARRGRVLCGACVNAERVCREGWELALVLLARAQEAASSEAVDVNLLCCAFACTVCPTAPRARKRRVEAASETANPRSSNSTSNSTSSLSGLVSQQSTPSQAASPARRLLQYFCLLPAFLFQRLQLDVAKDADAGSSDEAFDEQLRKQREEFENVQSRQPLLLVRAAAVAVFLSPNFPYLTRLAAARCLKGFVEHSLVEILIEQQDIARRAEERTSRWELTGDAAEAERNGSASQLQSLAGLEGFSRLLPATVLALQGVVAEFADDCRAAIDPLLRCCGEALGRLLPLSKISSDAESAAAGFNFGELGKQQPSAGAAFALLLGGESQSASASSSIPSWLKPPSPSPGRRAALTGGGGVARESLGSRWRSSSSNSASWQIASDGALGVALLTDVLLSNLHLSTAERTAQEVLKVLGLHSQSLPGKEFLASQRSLLFAAAPQAQFQRERFFCLRCAQEGPKKSFPDFTEAFRRRRGTTGKAAALERGASAQKIFVPVARSIEIRSAPFCGL